MSSTIISSTNFQSILNAALDSYAKQTGIDLSKHPSADKIQSCATSEDVLQLLQNREIAFKDYRDKHRKLINRLRPVIQVIHAFSGVLGEVAGVVSGSSPSCQVSFQPAKVIFVGVDVLLSVRISSTFSISYHRDTYLALLGRHWRQCKLRRPLRLRRKFPRASQYLYGKYPTGSDDVEHSHQDHGGGARCSFCGDQANQTGSFR
jgi:fungal STAND N-terminal Goodbye domain